MPRYFFDVQSNGNLVPDEIGTDFPSRHEVPKAAKDLLSAIAKDRAERAAEHETYTVSVRDTTGVGIYTATPKYIGL